MLWVKNFSLQFGQRFLFDKLNLTIFSGQKVALVGPNGAGKTSLLKHIIESVCQNIKHEEVEIARNTRVAYIQQELEDTDVPAIDFVMFGDARLEALKSKMFKAEQDQNYEQLAQLYIPWEEAGGFMAEAKAAEILHGLGFSSEELNTPIHDFSGGWRMRLKLARCLFTPADILLLDEPTNHLDLETISWLKKWLNKFNGTMVFVSHDRDFIDAIADNIASLENKSCVLYKGNYSTFEEKKAEAMAQQSQQFEKQQTQIAHMMAFVNKFKAKASKAKQAQSRMKAIGRMEKVAAVQMSKPFQFEFFESPVAGNPLIRLDQVSVGYEPGCPILKKLKLSVLQGDRIGLLGLNGAGKSTLIKTLSGSLQPETGEVYKQAKLKIGYFAQHQLEALNLEQTALWHLQEISTGVRELDLRKYLGKFMFGQEHINTPVGKFSGGEKARLAFAMIVWQRPNLLLLDEPSNHLDLDTREALMLALQSYEGAMILVAHDEFLLNNCVDQLWLIKNGGVSLFNDSVSEYLSNP